MRVLSRAGGHDAGQRPARHWQAAFIGPGRDDQALRPAKSAQPAVKEHDIERLERAPGLNSLRHSHAGLLRARDQRPAAGQLGIVGKIAGEGRCLKALLEELTAGHGTLVHQQHLGAGLGRNGGRVEPAGTAAQHQQVGLEGCGICLALRAPIDVPGDRQGILPTHPHRPVELGHAGALVRLSVDLHQAFLANAHAAEESARGARARLAQLALARGGQRRGKGFASPAANGPALEFETDTLGAGLRSG